MKIVIAEDEIEVRNAISLVLELAGYEVFSCEDGKRALECIKANLPDIVISDISMPNMNGYQLLRNMKETPDLKDIPVILLTAKDSTKEVLEGWSSGADYYITKPFTSDVLLLSIKHVRELRTRVS